MNIIETTFEKLPTKCLLIGFEGENLRATVRIDCSSVFAEYPNATPTLIVKPLFADAYPVVVDRNGTDVDWLITSEILSFSGDGEIQLVFYRDEVICKSAVSKIRVCRSLQVTGEMPDPVVQWIENANRKLAEVDAQIVELEGMVDTATDAATRAEQSASTASAKAEQAAGSAATATEKATEATNAAGTATAKAAEAALSATQASNSAMSAADSERGATAKAGEATTAAGTATTKAEQATEAAQTATEKAGDASASATAAHASATDAASSATAASASETAAKASETAASTSASQAGTSAQNAGTAAQTATQKSAEATQSATDAAASATNAATSAETASTKAGEAAQSAQAVAETAEQLADSLEQIDQNTQDIAELDERKANIDGYYPDMTVGNAEQLNSSKFVENSEPYTFRTSGGTSDIGNREYLDAVVGGTLAWNQMVRDEASENSTDFAPIVTVTDAVEDAAGVRVKIEPVQDLHGYDHPWPAGGGNNIWDEETEMGALDIATGEPSSSTKQLRAKNFIPVIAGNSYKFFTFNGAGKGIWVLFYDSNKEVITTGLPSIPSAINARQVDNGVTVVMPENCAYIRFYFQGYYGTTYMHDTAVCYPSTANAYSPYSNICPITGWDGVQVWDDPKYGGLIEWNQLASGKNPYTQNGISSTFSDGVYMLSGTPSGSYTANIESVIISNGHKYFQLLTIVENPNNLSFSVGSLNGGLDNASVGTTSKVAESSLTRSVTVGISGLRTGVSVDGIKFKYILCDLTQMFGEGNEPSTVEEFKALFPADYYPYNAGEITTVSAVNGDPYRHYSITLPTEAGTVYGGELTVNADGSGSLVVDRAMVDLGTLAFSYDSSGKRWQILVPDIVNYPSRNANILAEKYAADVTAIAGDIGKMFTTGKGLYIYDIDNENAPSGSFVYPLAIPTTYTLTASEIRTLLGQNNVWADTGDLALTYTGTDEHLTLESGKKYLFRISGTDSMLLGSGQEITAAKGTDNVFDLTQMFGTAVADYVYGQGAAFFRKWFGKQWYSYNAGELLSVEGLQSHDMVGFNAFNKNDVKNGVFINDENGSEISATGAITSGWIPVIGGATYYIKSDATSGNWGAWYDADKAYISGTSKELRTAPVNAAYLRFTVKNTASSLGSPDTLCINLAHNNSRNDEYAPYEKHSYPLDSTVILRGIPKVDANGVYWDGDRYLPDGTVERRYGVVDLGTLNWRLNTFSGKQIFVVYDLPGGVGTTGGTNKGNAICDAYPVVTNYTVTTEAGDKTMAYGAYYASGANVYVQDSDYSDPAAFKSAMQGVLLVYELATPTTETAQPYHSTQWVSDWGTEEFASTGIVPVGSETRYPANLRDKLQHLPDAASGNGSYLITQTDGQMVLTPFPAPPSTAGNYVLKATVTNGVATYTWEAAT